MSRHHDPKHALAASSSPLSVPAGADPTHFLPKVSVGRLWSLLLRRGWIVVLAVLLGGGALFALADRMPKIYRATGSVYVSTEAPLILDIRAVSPEETKDLEQLRSVEQVNLDQDVFGRILDYGKLQIHGTGEEDLMLPAIGDPIGMHRALQEAMGTIQDGATPVANHVLPQSA